MQVIHLLKLSLTRGYICLGIAALCLLFLLVLTLIYGDIKSISTDPSDPLVANGTLRYMEESAFNKYYRVSKLIAGIAFISGIIGVVLYLKSKYYPSS